MSSYALGEAELLPEVLAGVLSCYTSCQGRPGGVRMRNDVSDSLLSGGLVERFTCSPMWGRCAH
jgi:hypothetical protein